MCEAAERLTLCTCADPSAGEPDWVLERHDASRPASRRIGRALPPRFNAREQLCVDAIRAALTRGDCFDFDYAPREGDVLRLRARLVTDARQRRAVRFRFVGGEWTHDLSTSLSAWRQQMIEARRGRLG
ncbi:MAG: hypothetical protein H6713_15405 [Myxococcales bacterium]|nr:hypothetical protein [Myxococcales bacterium]